MSDGKSHLQLCLNERSAGQTAHVDAPWPASVEASGRVCV